MKIKSKFNQKSCKYLTSNEVYETVGDIINDRVNIVDDEGDIVTIQLTFSCHTMSAWEMVE